MVTPDMIDAAGTRRHSLSTMLRRSAARHRDRTAIVCGTARWSYAALDAIVDRLCRGLQARGVAKGDRVAVLARNSHAFVALRFAVARAGGVLVPVNFMLRVDEARYILEHSGSRFLFVDPTTSAVGRDAAPMSIEAIFGLPGEYDGRPAGIAPWDDLLLDGVSPEELADADDLLQIIYTSGTESRPKGATYARCGSLAVPVLRGRLRMDA